MPKPHGLLSSLQLPEAVARLEHQDKVKLAREVREEIIHTVSDNGGHLAPSLGVVELTIALLSVFNPEKDRIIWDVGHQCYPWKLLTGRAGRFHTLRRRGGLSGFPKPEESPCDAFGAGHASTSISAALGMAVARDLAGGNEHVVAIIGDGALSGGMALEALNQAGGMGRRLIVILNDNKMSISENVGALSLFLSRNLSKGWVMRIKRSVARLLLSIPRVGPWLLETMQRGENSFKSFFTPGMLFEAFRFNYIGPVPGHNISQLTRHLEMAKALDQPVLLHVSTRKGKGYTPAEEDPAKFHGVPSVEPETCLFLPPNAPTSNHSFTKVFGQALVEMGRLNPRVVAITAAMPDGTGTAAFKAAFPDRFVDVGICEEHAVTFAAGLAARGFRPVVAIYSTFLQRSYDQIIHDVCLQNLPVIFCLDRAGLVGQDGPTHHGAFDLSFLRSAPGLRIIAPRSEAELCHALFTAVSLGDAPMAIRYPRGSGPNLMAKEFHLLTPGQGELLMDAGNQAAAVIMGVGPLLNFAIDAAAVMAEEGLKISVFDVRWVKPLPAAQIQDLIRTCPRLLIVEENSAAGGLASAILECLADADLLANLHVERLSLPDAFVEHGTPPELHSALHLDCEGMLRALNKLLQH